MTTIRRTHSYQQILIRQAAYQLKREQNTLWFKAKRSLRKLRNYKVHDGLTIAEFVMLAIMFFVVAALSMIGFVEALP